MSDWSNWSDDDQAEFVRLVPRHTPEPVETAELTEPAEPAESVRVTDPTDETAEVPVIDLFPEAETPAPAETPTAPVEPPRRPVIVIDAENPVDLSRPDVGATIDPRLRKRRVDVKRAAARARFTRLGLIIGIGAILAGAVAFLTSSYFDVKSATITGIEFTDDDSVQRIADGLVGRSMFRVDLNQARDDIALQPWVRRVSIRRDWPDRIIVDIGERRPVASYPADDGEWRILDVEGRVLTRIENQPADFPPIVADQKAVDPGEFVGVGLKAGARVAQALPAELRARLSEIGISGVDSVELKLGPQGKVLLGPPTDLREKLISVLAALQRCGDSKFTTIDVRASADVVISPPTACPVRRPGTPTKP